jgi:hypothetical protein
VRRQGFRGDLRLANLGQAQHSTGKHEKDEFSDVLETEPDLHANLDVLDLAVDDLPTHLGDLKPVEVTQGLGSPFDAIADRLINALVGRANDLAHTVRSIRHA